MKNNSSFHYWVAKLNAEVIHLKSWFPSKGNNPNKKWGAFASITTRIVAPDLLPIHWMLNEQKHEIRTVQRHKHEFKW